MYSDDSQGGEPRRPKSWEIPPGYEFDETTHVIRRITHSAKEEQKPKVLRIGFPSRNSESFQGKVT
jgi:hypothetical protein